MTQPSLLGLALMHTHTHTQQRESQSGSVRPVLDAERGSLFFFFFFFIWDRVVCFWAVSVSINNSKSASVWKQLLKEQEHNVRKRENRKDEACLLRCVFHECYYARPLNCTCYDQQCHIYFFKIRKKDLRVMFVNTVGTCVIWSFSLMRGAHKCTA